MLSSWMCFGILSKDDRILHEFVCLHVRHTNHHSNQPLCDTTIPGTVICMADCLSALIRHSWYCDASPLPLSMQSAYPLTNHVTCLLQKVCDYNGLFFQSFMLCQIKCASVWPNSLNILSWVFCTVSVADLQMHGLETAAYWIRSYCINDCSHAYSFGICHLPTYLSLKAWYPKTLARAWDH